MAPEGMAVVLSALNEPCQFVFFFALFITCFVHNVDATISYDRKKASGHQNCDTTDTQPGPDPRHSLEKETEILWKKIRVHCEDQAISG